MTARHSDGQADRVADARRGAMYMRAEARRATESGVATATMPRRRRDVRRTQLAVLAMLWLVVAGITVLVGLYWRGPSEARPAAVTAKAVPAAAIAKATPAPAPAPKPAPKPAPTTSARAPEPTPVAVGAPLARPIAPPVRAAAASPVPSTRSTVAALAPVSRPVPVGRIERRAVSAPTDARLVVTTSPAGAVVTVDGIGWGASPAKIRYLPPGTKHVRVTKDGYLSQERAVQIGGGGTANVHIVLRPRGGAPRGRS